MNTNHPKAAPSPCHGGDGAYSATEQSNKELTSNGQEVGILLIDQIDTCATRSETMAAAAPFHFAA